MKPAIEWINEVGETVAKIYPFIPKMVFSAMVSGEQPPGIEVEKLIERIQKDATEHYTAWLVEDTNGMFLTMGDLGMFVWTNNKHKALHFCRRSDAERISQESEDAWRITEHNFAK